MATASSYAFVPQALPEPVVRLCRTPELQVRWELMENIDCPLPEFFGPVRIRIAAGYKFDLASVPRLFWRIVAPFELSGLAPLIHDWLYDHKGRLPQDENQPALPQFTRLEADCIFLALMERQGVPRWRRHLAFWAVRNFGGKFWPEPVL